MFELYKLNEELRVRYRAVGNQTGIDDLEMEVLDPAGSTFSGFPVTMSELSNGLYEASFTPTEIGRYWVKITSETYPENGDSLSFYVKDEFEVEVKAGGVVIQDSAGDEADVTPDGRLQVSTQPPPAPEGTIAVYEYEYGNVSNTHDNVYVIPNGETLKLTRLSGGAECDSDAGSSIELYYDPNGDGTGMTLIDLIFASGNSDQHDLDQEYVGDGTKSIRLRRRRFSGGSKAIYGGWRGYY